MNDSPDHPSDDDSDSALNDLLSPLKSLAPPLETQLASRAAIASELGHAAAKAGIHSLPWWRRSISVPLPIAASLAAVLCAALIAPSLWTMDLQAPADRPALPAHANDDDDAVPPSAPSTFASSRRAASQSMEYYETEVYLCGVGRLSSESGYVIREQ